MECRRIEAVRQPSQWRRERLLKDGAQNDDHLTRGTFPLCPVVASAMDCQCGGAAAGGVGRRRLTLTCIDAVRSYILRTAFCREPARSQGRPPRSRGLRRGLTRMKRQNFHVAALRPFLLLLTLVATDLRKRFSQISFYTVGVVKRRIKNRLHLASTQMAIDDDGAACRCERRSIFRQSKEFEPLKGLSSETT